uniref:FHA domain-containing protein n=1 Tax=Stomoxys calcitrans TaxID=35570 RepID=A0A1I8Q648_STOCA
MSKVKPKKSRTESGSETSEESSDSSSEPRSKEHLRRSNHKKHKKDKKQRKHKSESEKDSDNNSSGESYTSEKDRQAKVRHKRHKSRSRERERQYQSSKWESHSSGRNRSRERSRSRQRDRSHERNRERERRTSRDRDQKDRGNTSREDSRRKHANFDRNQQQRGGRSPRRERAKSSDRNYIKREQRSPPRRDRGEDNRFKNNKRDQDGDNKHFDWGKKAEDTKSIVKSEEPKEKEKPNFALSGALTEDTNKVNGVVIKYSEPLEARKPKRRWRLYPFKGETALPVLHIHRQSCFLVGRDRKVVDLAVDHPSCSKQHAALQYRLVPFEREDGTTGKRVRLYLIDLDSANGTFLNNKRIEPRKYYELMEKDVIKFGFSTREYVLLHENSKEDQEDDDIDIKEEPVQN